MCITANKVRGVRATVAADEALARVARQHNNVNVLCLGEKVDPASAEKIVAAWLATEFEGGRHSRRVEIA
jgi:ribose 5-phosphate isomerase B